MGNIGGLSGGLHSGAGCMPYTLIGVNQAAIFVNAHDAENALQMVWKDLDNIFHDVTNNEQFKLAHLQHPDNEDEWKTKYFLQREKIKAKQTRAVPGKRVRHMSADTKAFYEELQPYCKQYDCQDKLEYKPLSKSDPDSSICLASKGGSYPEHQDGNPDLLSVDLDHPKQLARGKGLVRLPFRHELTVGTSAMAVEGAWVQTHVSHGEYTNKKFKALTRMTTGVNSGHYQITGSQDGDCHHNSYLDSELVIPKERHDAKSKPWASFFDSNVPQQLLPQGDATPAEIRHMMQRRLTISVWTTCDPMEDKAIYVEGIKVA